MQIAGKNFSTQPKRGAHIFRLYISIHSHQREKNHDFVSKTPGTPHRLVLVIVANHLFVCLLKRFQTSLGCLNRARWVGRTALGWCNTYHEQSTKQNCTEKEQEKRKRKAWKRTYFNLLLHPERKATVGRREKWTFWSKSFIQLSLKLKAEIPMISC